MRFDSIKFKYLFFFIIILVANISYAGGQIRAVGSSTVYPFISSVAEKFGRSTKYKTPIIESIGTGGGFLLFCSADDTTKIVIFEPNKLIPIIQ